MSIVTMLWQENYRICLILLIIQSTLIILKILIILIHVLLFYTKNLMQNYEKISE